MKHRHDRRRVGFRMLARREQWTGNRAGVRKPPMSEPAGERWVLGRLWGFDVAAALSGDGFAQIVKRRKPVMAAE